MESGSLLNEIAYTSAVSDSNTGLYYMNARYYNPNTGRFLTQDSYKGNPYDPWTRHLYTYTGNNPVNMVDPTGHWARFLLTDSHSGTSSDYTPVVTPEPEPTSTPEPKITSTPDPKPTPAPIPTPVPGPTPVPDPDSNLGDEFFNNVTEVADTFWKSINLNIGVGGGLGSTFQIKKFLKASGVIKVDWWHLEINDGNISYDSNFGKGFKEKEAFGMSLFDCFGGGYTRTETTDVNTGKRKIEDEWVFESGLGGEYYFGFGGEFRISFNYVEFIEEINKKFN